MKLVARARFISLSVVLLLIPVLCYAQQNVRWESAPVNPEFERYIEQRSLEQSNSQTSEGAPSLPQEQSAAGQQNYSLGLIPTPIDFSQMARPVDGPADRSLDGTRLLSMPKPDSIPPAYDLRQQNRVTPVRNQGSCGSCWAFASFASLESSLMPWEQHAIGAAPDYSENNLKNTSGYSLGCCDGGSFLVAAAYLTRWSGPVLEAQDPYDASDCVSPTGIAAQKHVQEVIILPPKESPTDVDYIKEAVMRFGGLYVSMTWDYAAYYAPNSAYYAPQPFGALHAVTIVGWDDDYSRENFSPLYDCPGDGAFIVRNSWGTDWGDGGYFYVSYYTPRFASSLAGFQAEPVNNYAQNYQYDPLGWTASIGRGSDTAWFANVFTANASERVAAASFYAYQPGSSYELSVYLNPTSGPIGGTPVAVKSGTFEFAGYHTVRLDQSVAVQPDDKFSVVVRLTTPGYVYPIPIENNGSPTYSASADPGQSYVSADGVFWTDLTAEYPEANVCLKAFTVNCSQMSVSPQDTLQFAAPVGGPFNPIERTLVVSNTGETALDWSAVDPLPLVVDPAFGTLAPGQSVTVSVSPHPNMGQMPATTYTGFLHLANTTDGCGSTDIPFFIEIADGSLTVSPDRTFRARGPVGGPFSPSAQGFNLYNPGHSTISWGAAKMRNQAWLDLSASSGTLAGGERAVVTASVNASADSLPSGLYREVLRSTDVTNNMSIAVDVYLHVGRLYVKPTGSDSNDGTSWETAKATIGGAMTAAGPGQEIWVAAGTYSSDFVVKSGVALYGGFAGVGDTRDRQAYPTVLTSSQYDSGVTIQYGASSATRLDGFTIQSGSAGIVCQPNGSATICNNILKGIGGYGIYCNSATADCFMVGNTITATFTGIYLNGGSPTIANNILCANSSDDGSIYCYRSAAQILNNTIAGNNGGILIDECAPTLVNNIVALNSWGIKKLRPYYTPVLNNNCVYGNSDRDYQGISPGTGDFSDEDPIFANAACGNFHIQPTSPCRNRGDGSVVSVNWPDIDGQERVEPVGGVVDIGADESYGEIWPSGSAIVRVSYTGDDANDGSSWALAKRTVQAGIDAVAALGGGEVWVEGATEAERALNPDAGKYNERIVLRPYVFLYGGFDNDDLVREDRDWSANTTILDGTPPAGQEGGSVVTIVNAGYRGSTVDGFTIRHGTGTTPDGYMRYGGGIYCFSSPITIANNVITQNNLSGGYTYGAGLCCIGSDVNLTNNVITDNHSSAIAEGHGGAVYSDSGTLTLTANTITDNTSTRWGGAISCVAAVLNGNTFLRNSSSRGGVVCCQSQSSLTASNNVFAGNSADQGGAFYCFGGTLRYNTFTDNTATIDGGAVYINGEGRIENNIIAFGSSGICAVYFSPTIAYNCFHGNTAYDCLGVSTAYGNIYEDPLFADRPGGNYRLVVGSPCVDAGLSSTEITSDIEGAVRPIDGDANGSPRYDIGAYELMPQGVISVCSPAVVDFDGDGDDEVVFGGVDGMLHVVRADGTQPAGWPVSLGKMICRAPAVGDLNGDSRLDIAVTVGQAGSGKLLLVDHSGAVMPGWPQGGEYGDFHTSPVLADIDNDGGLEIIVGSNCYNVWAFEADGTILQNWPVSVGMDMGNNVTAADIDGDSVPEVVVFEVFGRLSAFNGDGSAVFQTYSPFGVVPAGPTLADIDSDGKSEIIAVTECDSHYGAVFIIDETGAVLPNWPWIAGDCIFRSPALGDLNQDGVLDIVLITNGGVVHAVGVNGVPTPGWTPPNVGEMPADVWACTQESPVIGDIDGDGYPEVVVAWFGNQIHAFNHDGSVAAGWPKTAPSPVRVTPAIGDTDADGRCEVILATTDGQVIKWESDAGTGLQPCWLFPWTTYAGNNLRENAYKCMTATLSTSLSVPDVSAVLGQAAGLTATLTFDSGSRPLAGKTVSFSVAGVPVGTAVTDSAGVATLDYTPQDMGVLSLSASFAGDLYYGGSSGSADLTVAFSRVQANSSIALADIDGDGNDETIVGASDGSIHVLKADGTELAGWPQNVGSAIWDAPAIADVDNDGQPEIVVNGRTGVGTGRIYAFNADGTSLLGWPQGEVWGYPNTSPVLADTDGDGFAEIFIGTENMSVWAANHDGTPISGWSGGLIDPVIATPAVGDMDGDGIAEILGADTVSCVMAWNGDGSTMSGWPSSPGVQPGGPAFASPALADLDGDSKLEAVLVLDSVSAPAGKITVLDGDGSTMSGWPVNLNCHLLASPAIGDLDGDGTPDIVVAATDGKVYAYTPAGTPTSGWVVPDTGVTTPCDASRLQSSPVLGDIDGDGSLEVVVGCYDGKVYAFNHDGSILPGWPKMAGAPVRTTPAIGNMDGDNSWDIVVSAEDGAVYRWEVAGNTGTMQYAQFPWPTFHGNNRRTGAYAPYKTIYVRANSPYDGPGHDWDHAYHSVQAAIDAASPGDEVWVAGGYYIERITLKNGVRLYGGFAGAGKLRNLNQYYSVLDANGTGTVVTSPVGATVSTVIDGFTLTHGTGTPDGSQYYGGGLYCRNSSPMIAHNWFVENDLQGSKPPWSEGTGIYCEGSPLIIGNTFCWNWLGYGPGGAISIRAGSPKILSNLFVYNFASAGGGIFISFSTSPVIMGNVFQGNYVDLDDGGGIFCYSSGAVIANNVFQDNYAGAYGGGIYCDSCSPTITNNTFLGNDALFGGGIACYGASPSISNNIISWNYSGIYVDNGGAPVLRNNCVFGHDGGDYVGLQPGVGDIRQDPLFAYGGYDWHILTGSPCINAGWDQAPGLSSLLGDVDGQPRLNGTVDIGADEVWP